MDSIKQAQNDMNDAYFYGVSGVISSGSVWLASGLVALMVSMNTGIMTLVFGGMLIFPISLVLCKLFGRSGKHDSDNPLAPLALEGTFWMLLSIPIAIAVALYKPEWFYSAMLLVIAGRYLTFNTLYGNRVFWLFSIVMVIAAFALLALHAPSYLGGIVGGIIELLFALIIYINAKHFHPKSPVDA